MHVFLKRAVNCRYVLSAPRLPLQPRCVVAVSRCQITHASKWRHKCENHLRKVFTGHERAESVTLNHDSDASTPRNASVELGAGFYPEHSWRGCNGRGMGLKDGSPPAGSRGSVSVVVGIM